MGFFTKNTETKAVNPYDLVEPVDLIKYGYIPECVFTLPFSPPSSLRLTFRERSGSPLVSQQ